MDLIKECDDDFGYHFTHCCVYSCKYGDDRCPIAHDKVLPKYRCEDCTCLQVNLVPTSWRRSGGRA